MDDELRQKSVYDSVQQLYLVPYLLLGARDKTRGRRFSSCKSTDSSCTLKDKHGIKGRNTFRGVCGYSPSHMEDMMIRHL